MSFREIEGKQKLKASFILDNTALPEMFKSICQELPNWDTSAINTDRWHNRTEVEKVLQRLNFPYKTIGSWSKRELRRILKEEQPDVVVVGHDRGPMNSSFIEFANSTVFNP